MNGKDLFGLGMGDYSDFGNNNKYWSGPLEITFTGNSDKNDSENNEFNSSQPTTTAREISESQANAMNYNALEAQKARDWQERMYGSRWQKTVQDIKKAGLNPYIMNMFSPGGFSGGSAAQIASNVMKAYGVNKSKNVNKKEASPIDWFGALMPLIGTIVGSFVGPFGGAIGGSLGSLAARHLRKKH